jgi:hypothetical protein
MHGFATYVQGTQQSHAASVVICPKNKPFFAETLYAEKAVAGPPKPVNLKIIGEHKCEGRAKAAAVPPRKFCYGSNGFTIMAVLIIIKYEYSCINGISRVISM